MTATSVSIIDIGMGNLRSVANAVFESGFDPEIIKSPEYLGDTPRVILPGVGSFRAASQRLQDGGWVKALQDYAATGRPLLGICLGMQLLASRGDEGGEVGGSLGLDLIPGRVIRLADNGLRIPHVGWNSVLPQCAHPVLEDIKPGRDFYFVHSYYFAVDENADCLALTDYGGPVTAAVARGNVLGTQFHPEKSQRNGLALLEAFLDWDGVL